MVILHHGKDISIEQVNIEKEKFLQSLGDLSAEFERDVQHITIDMDKAPGDPDRLQYTFKDGVTSNLQSKYEAYQKGIQAS